MWEGHADDDHVDDHFNEHVKQNVLMNYVDEFCLQKPFNSITPNIGGLSRRCWSGLGCGACKRRGARDGVLGLGARQSRGGYLTTKASIAFRDGSKIDPTNRSHRHCYAT